MSETNPTPAAEPKVIKRYTNRKLYDTVESRYVTLPQIAEYVRQGEDVRIIDNTTKEDLTRMTLAQILYEEERKQSSTLPLTTLKDLLNTARERVMLTLPPVARFIGRDAEKPEETPVEEPVPEAPPLFSAYDPTVQCPAGEVGWDLSTGGGLDPLQRNSVGDVIKLINSNLTNCGLTGTDLRQACDGETECTKPVTCADSAVDVTYVCGTEAATYTARVEGVGADRFLGVY